MQRIRPITGNYSLDDDDEIIFADATSGAIAVTLMDLDPSSFIASPAKWSSARLLIRKTDSSVHTVTISAASGKTIDGGSSVTLTTQGAFIELVNDTAGNYWSVGTGGTITGGSQDPLGKAFFVANSLMPSGTIKEELITFPAPDFTNLSGGSIARNMSRAKIIGASPSNVGWNLGATYHKVLIIMGMTRAMSYSGGLFIGKTTPSTPTEPQGYFAVDDNFAGGMSVYKADGAGSHPNLATEATVQNPNSYWRPSTAMALYIDDSTGRIVYFLKYGSEQWWPVLDITDTTYAGFVSAGIMIFDSGPAMWWGCPLGIYAQ